MWAAEPPTALRKEPVSSRIARYALQSSVLCSERTAGPRCLYDEGAELT
jgi:hypothetical protein